MKYGWFAIFWIAACVLASAQAAAQVPAPVRIRYTQVEGCPADSLFTERVFSRTLHLRPALGDEAAIEIELTLSSRGAEYQGALRYREQNGRVTERAVSGTNCDEVVSALALVVAVLGDPEAQALTQPEGARNPELAPSRAAERAPSPRTSVPARRPARPSPPPKVEKPAPQVEAPRSRSELHWFVGAGALMEGAVAPSNALGASLELGLGVGNGGVLSPVVLLSANRGLAYSEETPSGDAELTWTAARLGLCPLRWPADGEMALRPCASFDAGMLQGSGSNTSDPDNATAPWWAIGSFARLEAQIVSRLAGVLDGGFLIPLRHDRFYFDPDAAETTAFQVPTAGAFARLGILLSLN